MNKESAFIYGYEDSLVRLCSFRNKNPEVDNVMWHCVVLAGFFQ